MTITDIPAAALPYQDDLFAQPPGRAAEERDRWKRRLIVHPYTGEKVPWTAVTTFIGALKDAEGLIKWTARQVVVGLGVQEELAVRAAGTDPSDTRSLDQIVEDAKRAAGSFRGATLGTALHGFQERVDRGEPHRAPAKYASDLEAYQGELDRQGLKPAPEYLERFVLIPKYQLIGRLDTAYWRGVRAGGDDANGYEDQELHLGDRKTKQSAKSWYEEACQLGLYSLATHFFDPDTLETTPVAPALAADTGDEYRPWNMNAGVIVHAPAGTGTAQAKWSNLKLGRQVAAVAHALRCLRAEKDYVADMEPLGLHTS